MSLILTLIADAGKAKLDPAALDLARAALGADGARVGKVDWLAPEIAADMIFAGLGRDHADRVVHQALGAMPIDAVVQPPGHRRKRLLVADMDSTTITVETIVELAELAGVRDQVERVTERSMLGEVDFRESLIFRVALLDGVRESGLDKVFAEKVRLMPGARALVATMRAHGAYTVLISGGFTYFTRRVREMAGFDADQGNHLEIIDGRLTGRVLEPIINRDGKQLALERIARERKLSLADTMAVGDGANDLAMLKAAGLGVAFRAKPIVAEAAPARIEHADLTALLYLQGYRAGDIVER